MEEVEGTDADAKVRTHEEEQMGAIWAGGELPNNSDDEKEAFKAS